VDPLPCPRCGTTLAKAGTRGQVDACPRCHGVLLDPEELARALDPVHARLLSDAIHASPVPAAGCPRCGVDMREVRFVDVGFTLDGCPRCGGFWCDAGELEKVRDAGLVPWRHGLPDVHPATLRTARGVVLGGAGLFGLWSLLRR
jgi:Zn-finger nucleic acid-binding protein